MTLDSRLKEIKELADKHGSMRSDDFGHDTHKLLLAEAEALTYWTETAGPMLLEMVEIMHRILKFDPNYDLLKLELEKIAEKYSE